MIAHQVKIWVKEYCRAVATVRQSIASVKIYWISASTCPNILFIHRVSIHLNGSLSPRECWNISLKKILLAWFERLCLFSKQLVSKCVWVNLYLIILHRVTYVSLIIFSDDCGCSTAHKSSTQYFSLARFYLTYLTCTIVHTCM